MSSQQTQNPDKTGAPPPDAPELTDAETVEQLIAQQEAETGRRYVCLDCETTVEGFPVECPECGSSSFETAPAADTAEDDTPAEHVLAAYAELSAPYNPYVPR